MDANLELYLACQKGSVDEIVRLLSPRAKVNEPPSHNFDTPLQTAIRYNHLPAVEALLTLGADPMRPDSKGRSASALSFALLLDKDQSHVPIARLLLHHGVALDSADPDGNTALMIAVRKEIPEVIERLLALGASVDACTASGNTALIQAASRGKLSTLTMLLEAGAHPNHSAMLGNTPLLAAVVHTQYANTLALLAAGADPFACRDVLIGAKPDGRNDYAQGRTALMLAAASGSEPLVDIFLGLGVDPLATDSKGMSAADLAFKRGHPDITALIHAHIQKTALRDSLADASPISPTKPTLRL